MTGPLEPATQAFIDSLYTLSPEAARNVLAGAQKSVSVTLAPARSEDRVLNVGPKGRTNVRIYRPENSKGTLPVVIYTGRKGAEAEARESDSRHREVQTELAHANRVTTMGKLTASISHEVKQPIAAMVTNAQAALHWLDRQPPDLEEVRQALASVVKDGDRARDVIDRIRALIKKAPPRKDHLEINGVIHEVIELTRGEALKNGVSVRTKLADGLPIIQGDRVHLQQVILNLIINAVEAMSGVSEGTRELLISTSKAEPGVLVAVRDSGPGLAPATLEHVFDSFYTTKASGLGIGLSICRSIIEAHGGRLWASPNVPRGAIFQFTLVEGRNQS
jgi:C4-dicarboxylate-specific signal transduction histidine kinase